MRASGFAPAGCSSSPTFSWNVAVEFSLLSVSSSPLAAAAIISDMIVAIATVHWRNGLLALTNGIELPLLYLTAALSLALTGPGGYSLDAVLGLSQLWTPEITAIVLAAGVVGGFASLGMRRPAPAIAHA